MNLPTKDEKYISTIRKLGTACTTLADALEKDEPNEQEVNAALVAFVMAIIEAQAL